MSDYLFLWCYKPLLALTDRIAIFLQPHLKRLLQVHVSINYLHTMHLHWDGMGKVLKRKIAKYNLMLDLKER